MGVKAKQPHNINDLDAFNLGAILKPYHSAGTKSHPHKMTLETVAGALIINDKIPADIAGAVIFQTCTDIVHNGLDFPGNGQYGSKWRELYNHMRAQSLELMNRGAARAAATAIMNQHLCMARQCPVRTKKPSKQHNRVINWLMAPRLGIMQCAVIGGLTGLFIAYYDESIQFVIKVLSDLI